MNKNIIWIAVVVVVVGIGAWAFFMNSPVSQPENSNADNAAVVPPADTSQIENPQPESASTTTPSEANQPANQKEFTVTGQNFSFTPSTITVKKGDAVKIIFQNAGGLHDLRIDEFGVATKKTVREKKIRLNLRRIKPARSNTIVRSMAIGRWA